MCLWNIPCFLRKNKNIFYFPNSYAHYSLKLYIDCRERKCPSFGNKAEGEGSDPSTSHHIQSSDVLFHFCQTWVSAWMRKHARWVFGSSWPVCLSCPPLWEDRQIAASSTETSESWRPLYQLLPGYPTWTGSRTSHQKDSCGIFSVKDSWLLD